MKKILLTGGAGYIGSHIAVALVDSGFEPIVLDNFCNSSPSVIPAIESIVNKPIRFYDADCCDVNALLKIVEKEKTIDGIIHLAAYKAVGESMEKPLEYYENNIGAMMAVMRAVIAAILFRSEEHTSELESRLQAVCRLLLEKKLLGLSRALRGCWHVLLVVGLVPDVRG